MGFRFQTAATFISVGFTQVTAPSLGPQLMPQVLDLHACHTLTNGPCRIVSGGAFTCTERKSKKHWSQGLKRKPFSTQGREAAGVWGATWWLIPELQQFCNEPRPKLLPFLESEESLLTLEGGGGKVGYQNLMTPVAPQLRADMEAGKRAIFKLLKIASPPTQLPAYVCLSFHFLGFKWKICESQQTGYCPHHLLLTTANNID